MKTIYVVRHGENHANITKEFSHRYIDYSLTAKGREQALQTAEWFSDVRVDRVFSSPLKRAQETAQPIAERWGLPVELVEELREVNVGTLEVEGDLTENWRLHNRIMRGWFTDRPDVRLPGGENLHELRARVRAAFEDILVRTREAAVVVAHGGVIAFGIPGIADVNGFDVAAEHHNCSITTVTFRDGIPGSVQAWGEWSHLRGEAAQVISGVLRTDEPAAERARDEDGVSA